jgi:hypothetical protein
MELRGIVTCPKCGKRYHRALYDFDYIMCTESGCGQVFIKCTGQPWPKNSEPAESPATDRQQLKAAIALVRDAAHLYLTDSVECTDFINDLETIEQRAAV